MKGTGGLHKKKQPPPAVGGEKKKIRRARGKRRKKNRIDATELVSQNKTSRSRQGKKRNAQ